MEENLQTSIITNMNIKNKWSFRIRTNSKTYKIRL